MVVRGNLFSYNVTYSLTEGDDGFQSKHVAGSILYTLDNANCMHMCIVGYNMEVLPAGLYFHGDTNVNKPITLMCYECAWRETKHTKGIQLLQQCNIR